MIWLTDEGGNALTGAIYSLIRKLTRSERWSRSISQYNLISSSIKSEPPRCLKLLGIDEMMRQMHVNRKDLNVGLQGLIFEHLREKAQKIKEDFNVVDKNVRSKIIGQRGDGVLEREGVLQHYKWCTTEVEFSRSILVWHLATEICYLDDNKDGSNVSSEYERSRCLSEYMMYLLVIRPNMLSKGFSDEEGYLETLGELRGLKDRGHDEGYQRTLRELWRLKDRDPDDEEYQCTLRDLRNSESRGFESFDDRVFQRCWKTEKSVARGVVVLARQLLLLETEKRREMINEVWVEMVAYAASHCPWKEHTHQLRRGGELLTHVSLLMLHFGLSEQYEFKDSEDPLFDFNDLHEFKQFAEALTGEDQEEYFKARNKYFQGTVAAKSGSSPHKEEEYFQAGEKYLEGTTIMSGSSPEEELKKLEKIVADTKRELEHKNQELEREERELEHQQRKLEQLRSFLTASNPQQGIDSLTRSLSAQTDGQGTGQPPLNNEISLSME